MGRRLDELPIVREQSSKVSQDDDRTKGEEDDEAVARTGPNGRRVTSSAP